MSAILVPGIYTRLARVEPATTHAGVNFKLAVLLESHRKLSRR